MSATVVYKHRWLGEEYSDRENVRYKNSSSSAMMKIKTLEKQLKLTSLKETGTQVQCFWSSYAFNSALYLKLADLSFLPIDREHA